MSAAAELLQHIPDVNSAVAVKNAVPDTDGDDLLAGVGEANLDADHRFGEKRIDQKAIARRIRSQTAKVRNSDLTL